jgi:hypothetical protein
VSATALERPASVFRVRRWIRRRQRANTPGSDRFETAYTVVLFIGMVGFAVWSQLQSLLSGQTGAGLGAREGVTLAAGLAWLAAVFAATAALGPVTAAGPALQWLLTAPLSRRRLLLPAAVQAIGIGLLAGLAQGLFTLTLSTAGAGWVLLTAMAGGLISVGVAVGLQALVRRPARWLARLATVLVVAAAGVGVLSAAGTPVGAVAWTGPWGWPLAAAHHPQLALAVTVVALVVPLFIVYGLSAITLANLTDAAQSSGAATAVFITLDPGLAARAAEERRWKSRRLGPNQLPQWPAARVAVGQDALLLRRSPVRVLLTLALITVPVLATGLPVSRWFIAAVWLLSGLAALSATTANARRDRDDPALARLLGLTDADLFRGRLVVPTVAATVWSTGALLAIGLKASAGSLGSWIALGVCAGPGLAAGALRAARRKAVRQDADALVTPAGLMPTGWVQWLIGAVDVAVLALWPTLLAIARQRPEVGIYNELIFGIGALAGLAYSARR